MKISGPITVDCPHCAMPVGVSCQDKAGRDLPPSRIHGRRVDAYHAAQEALSRTVGTGPANKSDSKVKEAMESYAEQDLRNARIDGVLMGMKLYRRLGFSQEALDRRLAEMIVDNKLDL